MAVASGDKVALVQGADGKLVAFGPIVAPASGDPVALLLGADGNEVAAAFGGDVVGECRATKSGSTVPHSTGPALKITISGMRTHEMWNQMRNGVNLICPNRQNMTWKKTTGGAHVRINRFQVGTVPTGPAYGQNVILMSLNRSSPASAWQNRVKFRHRNVGGKATSGTTGTSKLTYNGGPAPAYAGTGNLPFSYTLGQAPGFFQSITVTSNFGGTNHPVTFTWDITNAQDWIDGMSRSRTFWSVSTYVSANNYYYRFRTSGNILPVELP